MHIIVDGRPFSGGYNGYTSHITSLLTPLLDAGWRATLVSNRPFNQSHRLLARVQTEQFGLQAATLWEQWSVPRYLKHHSADVYLADMNKGLPWRRQAGITYVLTLHDIIPYLFPRLYMLHPRFVWRELRPVAQLSSIWRANAIITVSAASARDIHRVFHKTATPLMQKPVLRSVAAPPKLQPQFVFMGGVDQRKRVPELLQAFASFRRDHPDYKLVLLGRGYAEAYGHIIRDLQLQEAVEMPGFVDDDVKMTTIAASQAMVYPSLYEGYGLQIIEGFLAGSPVIAGRGGAQVEVGGNGALYVNPLDPTSIRDAMEQILDPAVRRQLVQFGQAQLTTLMDADYARQIAAYFTGLLKEKQPA